ncbi:hypothetical protein SAMN05216436_10187 [bacterium A37T11]|nr:hypothetical protein SAMN05216436_10187 [bacterium A37T11]
MKISEFPRREMEKENSEWAETKAFERELRWLRIWNWAGWVPLIAVLQLLVLLGLFLWSGPLIRLFDPTSSVIDAGTLSPCLLALLVVDLCAVSAWLILRLIRDGLTSFYQWDNEQEGFTNQLSACLAAKILSFSFWGLLLLSVVLFWGLL